MSADDIQLNPFAATLLAESLLRSPDAALTVGKPFTVEVPIKRGDCPGWRGVRVTLEALPAHVTVVDTPHTPPIP
jgi:hypothetical protein